MSNQQAKQEQIIPSQSILDSRWDAVIANGITKTTLGLVGGIVASVLFKRRPAFVFLGTGMGFGMAFAEGNAIFKSKAGIRSINA